MIAYLSGTLAEKKPTEATIDVGGIGYLVLIPTSTFEKLPDVGKACKLMTHHHVREEMARRWRGGPRLIVHDGHRPR